MPQCLEVRLQAELHKEVVHSSLVHQGDAGRRGPESGAGAGTGTKAGDRAGHSLCSQGGSDGVLHEHRQGQQLAQLHRGLICV